MAVTVDKGVDVAQADTAAEKILVLDFGRSTRS